MILVEFDPFKVVKAALAEGGEYADVYVEESSNTSIVSEESRIEKVVSGMDRGCGIRVIAGLKTFYAYTNDTSERALVELAGVVAGGVKDAEAWTGDIGLINKESAPGFEIKKHPSTVPLSEKAALVNEAERVARGVDKRVVQVKVVYGDGLRRSAVINSLGEWIEEERCATLFVVQAVTRDGDVMQTGYEPLGGAAGLEIFDSTHPNEVARRAAARAVMMLSALRAPGGHMPVVLSSEAGGTMIHEAVGHGLEADLAGENLSVYADKIGQIVAAPIITVLDDATIPNKRGSFFFDDEGSRAEKSVLVENGVLKGYMHDRLSAMKAGCASTGNGRRQSYQHRPIPRMTNTIIAPGTTPPEDILKSLDKGLYVKRMGGGQVNTVNGDFVFEVTEGYLIENGEQGEPVRGATLTGNGPDILKKIDMVGSDLGFGIGTCGKDAQGVPVADAQPTLRIPGITVGGSAKAEG